MSIDCNGPDCASCNRIDSESLANGRGELITYLGEYAVLTTMSPEFESPQCEIADGLGLIRTDAYQTQIIYLGDEKAAYMHSRYIVEDADYYRYWVRHDDYDKLEEVHAMVVSHYKDGLIDVSTPRGDEYKKERDENLERLRLEAKAYMQSGGSANFGGLF